MILYSKTQSEKNRKGKLQYIMINKQTISINIKRLNLNLSTCKIKIHYLKPQSPMPKPSPKLTSCLTNNPTVNISPHSTYLIHKLA